MDCANCGNNSSTSGAFVGTQLKFAVSITADGFDMSEDEWKIIVTRGKNTQVFDSTTAVEDADGQWYITVDTLALGAGQAYITYVAYVPDEDCEGGYRTEIDEAPLVIIRPTKAQGDFYTYTSTSTGSTEG